MTADEVRRILAALGHTQRGFARAQGVNERTTRRWVEDGAGGVAEALLRALEAGVVRPPPESLAVDLDRDVPCGEALDPHLDALRDHAEAAGWHPAEIVAAVLGWSLHAATEGAGPDAVREILTDALEMLPARQSAREDRR